MSFQVFRRASTRSSDTPTITIQRNGSMSLSGSAHGLLSMTKEVELLFDPDARAVGLRATSGSPDSYTVRSAANSKTGSVLVSSSGFINHYGIGADVGRRWTPRVERGMLVFGLDDYHVRLGQPKKK
ncbi:hypothetical protein [Kocuria rosea]|uniref:hypothetical protein n=1 Tax=Kocuria rosea TaxID=1275 RepID=UPI003016DBB1